MDTRITRTVNADPEAIYALAAAVEDWPRLLPHYRWVYILANRGPHQRTVEMAARRYVLNGLAIPLWWRAIQSLHPQQTAIEFNHIEGVTRGMRVMWTIQKVSVADVEVTIRHVFTPAWPLPDSLVHAVIGEYFVNAVARRTLASLCEIAQRAS